MADTKSKSIISRLQDIHAREVRNKFADPDALSALAQAIALISLFEERAGIIEHEAGMSRADAESAAASVVAAKLREKVR